jgi:hypothetical protein
MEVLSLIFLAFILSVSLVPAAVVYSFFKGTRSIERHAGLAFWTVLAFGGFGFVGVVVVLVLQSLLFRYTFLESRMAWVFGALIYSVCGAGGSWLFVWAIREFRRWNLRHAAANNSLTE